MKLAVVAGARGELLAGGWYVKLAIVAGEWGVTLAGGGRSSLLKRASHARKQLNNIDRQEIQELFRAQNTQQLDSAKMQPMHSSSATLQQSELKYYVTNCSSPKQIPYTPPPFFNDRIVVSSVQQAARKRASALLVALPARYCTRN